jgi:hypothetical protein
MRVLILAQERNHRGALAVSRALAKAGYLVGVGSADPTSIVAASRATHRWHSIPAPTDDLDAFLCATQEAVKDVGNDLIPPAETPKRWHCRSDVTALKPACRTRHTKMW